MKLRWTSSNKPLIKFLVFLFIMGILIGIYLFLNQKAIIKSSIINEMGTIPSLLNKKNFNFNNIIIISLLTILSFTIIGLPIILFYFFYEGVSLGFLMSSLYQYKKVNGLLFCLPLTIINKLFIYFLLIYLIINTYHYSKKIITNWHYNKSSIILNQLTKSGFILGILLIYEVIYYFLGSKILSLFLFLL